MVVQDNANREQGSEGQQVSDKDAGAVSQGAEEATKTGNENPDASQQPESKPTEAEGGEVGEEAPDFLPRDVFEAKLQDEIEKAKRQMQSAKDKELKSIREQMAEQLEAMKNATGEQPQQPANQQSEGEMTTEQFIEMLQNGGDAIGALKKSLRNELTAEQQAQMQAEQQKQQQLQQYANALENEIQVAGLNPKERAEAIRVADEAIASGQFIAPTDAVLTARWGSKENALKNMSEAWKQRQAQANTQQQGEDGQQNPTRKPPPVPGGATGTVPNPQEPEPERRFKPGAYRDLLR